MDNIEQLADELTEIAERDGSALPSNPDAHTLIDGLDREDFTDLLGLARQRLAHRSELIELHEAEVAEIEAEIRRREGGR